MQRPLYPGHPSYTRYTKIAEVTKICFATVILQPPTAPIFVFFFFPPVTPRPVQYYCFHQAHCTTVVT